MSTAIGSEQSNAKGNKVAESELHGLESSNDSSESSDSQSESGDSSSDSTGSSSDQDQPDGGSVKQSEDERGSSNSVKSNESFKSFNASVVKEDTIVEVNDSENETKKPVTSTKSVVKTAVKPLKTKSPDEVKLKASYALDHQSAASEDDNPPNSPVLVTPAKSLVMTASPSKEAEIEVDFNEIVAVSKAKVLNKHHQQKSPTIEAKPVLSSGECTDSESIKLPQSADVSGANETDKSKKRARVPSKVVRKEPKSPTKSPKKKHSRSDKAEKVKSKRSKSVGKVERQMKALQAQDEVKKKGSGHKKRSKKSKKQKKSKNKKAKAESSDKESSQSSASDEPTTSSRIGKLSTSRKLQQAAMSRAKQLGAFRQGEIHEVEVLDALKKIDKTIFPTEPTQAYSKFYSVPGVGLHHSAKHLEELQGDVGSMVSVSAKLNLELAQEHNTAKKQRVGPEAGNKFALIWQFQNDLSRAVAVAEQRDGTPVGEAGVSGGSGVKVGSDGGGGKLKAGEQNKGMVDDQGNEAASSTSLKSSRKRKTTESKSEDQQ